VVMRNENDPKMQMTFLPLECSDRRAAKSGAIILASLFWKVSRYTFEHITILGKISDPPLSNHSVGT
jgi:hypothetical protein